MTPQHRRPQWQSFYAIAGLMLLLVFWTIKQESDSQRMWAQIGIVALGYYAIYLWVKENYQ